MMYGMVQERGLTETDVVGEIVQELMALILQIPAGWTRAPGRHVGCGVVHVVWCDRAACDTKIHVDIYDFQ